MICPLCFSSNVLLCEKIEVLNLIEIYKNGRLPPLDLDVTSEFNDLRELCFCQCLDCDLRYFDPEVTGSEQFYERLQEFEWYYKDEKEEYEYASRFIKPSDAVLEIGSGKGAFAKIISTRNYTGLEFSQHAIEAASKDNISVLNRSVQEYANSHSGKFDFVCAFQVLEHVSDVHSFIESSIACLKPGGLLVFSVPSYDSFVSIVTNNATNMPPHHVTWWSDKCLSSVAGIFGLELVEIYHDKITSEYEPVYVSTIVLSGFKRMLGVETKLVDLSLNHKILEKLARFGGRFIKQGLLDPRVLADVHGHSVNVVYQKPRTRQ